MSQLFKDANFVYRSESDSGSLLNISQVFESFNQNPKRLQWQRVLTTLENCRVMF